MSNSATNGLRSALVRAGSVVQSGETVLSSVRVLAFWVAVALPFLYLPLLFTGLETTATTVAFIALLAVNAIALFVGHAHRRD